MSAKIIFFDDFSAAELDRAKWNVFTTGPCFNNEQQAYVDSPETIYVARGDEAEGAQNGALALHARYQPEFTTPDLCSLRSLRRNLQVGFADKKALQNLSGGIDMWTPF